ncbi:hypothetical protein HN011_009840 [Eciton burchellii]|nr:hypothetical protein HN011_009840 [Eciton burchellii]
MARRGEYEVKTWQGFSQNYSPRTAPSVRAAMHKRSQKLRSALPLDSAPPILWRTRFRYSTDLATLFDLKFPAHLAAACIHWFNMPTCKGIFSLPDATRRIRKNTASHLFPSLKRLIAEKISHSDTLRVNKRAEFSFSTNGRWRGEASFGIYGCQRCYV